MRRGLGIYKEQRQLLDAAKDYEFVEMKDCDKCCGMAGAFGVKYTEISMPILKNKVDNKEFEVAFLMYKTDISEIKKIADLGLIMPPKSTYIEPKFRVGLTIFETE